MEPLQPGVHHFGAPRVTAERREPDVQIPREGRCRGASTLGSREEGLRTDRGARGPSCGTRGPRRAPCRRCACGSRWTKHERGQRSPARSCICGGFAKARTLHRPSTSTRWRRAPPARGGLGVVDRERPGADDILEASASVEARARGCTSRSWMDGDYAAEALGADVAAVRLRGGDARRAAGASSAVQPPIPVVRRGAHGEPRGGSVRPSAFPSALSPLRPLGRDPGHVVPRRGALRIKSRKRRGVVRGEDCWPGAGPTAVCRTPQRPRDQAMLWAFDPSLLDEDAERSLCRECQPARPRPGGGPGRGGCAPRRRGAQVAAFGGLPQVDDCGADSESPDGATPLMNCAGGPLLILEVLFDPSGFY